jgi:hypothetical protein
MAERVRNYSREFERRQARAKEQGWSGYRQQRRYRAELTDARVRELAAQIGGPVEPERGGSLMSRKANRIVNPPDQSRRPGDWQLRLLRAAGEVA